MCAAVNAPRYEGELYADEAIANPVPHYAAMRALGPVVYIPQLDNYALTHHQTVKDALRKHADFISGEGVSADAFGSSFQRGNIVASDPPRHTAMRKAMLPTLMPKSIEGLRENFERLADDLVTALVAGDEFDAISDFASFLPLTVVRDLIGLPEFGKQNMLKWAGAAFDVSGIQNERGQRGVEAIHEMRAFVSEYLTADGVKPGSWSSRVFELVESGKLPSDLAPFVIRDYINPSLDTTISAIGHLIRLLSDNPDQWQMLRANPDLARTAISEAIRLGTPIRSFSRIAARDLDVSGVTIPAGSRVMMLFASANRDEAVFANPDQFDITRTVTDHLGFGHGIHTCVGMHLAQMEIMSLIRAMIPLVATIETGDAVPVMNNTICGFANLPTRFHAVP